MFMGATTTQFVICYLIGIIKFNHLLIYLGLTLVSYKVKVKVKSLSRVRLLATP